jgi:hypothetical protein
VILTNKMEQTSPLRRGALVALLLLVFVTILELRAVVLSSARHQLLVDVPEGPRDFYNHSATRPDPIAGYRFLPGDHRIMRTHWRRLISDAQIHVNAQGFIAREDFRPGRLPGVFRVAVLGDSFTAALNFSTPWPNRAQDNLRRQPGTNYEINSFALPGTTPGGWRKLFFDEIVPNFPFDAVIIEASTPYFNLEHPSEIRTPEKQTPLTIPETHVRSDKQLDARYEFASRWRWRLPDALYTPNWISDSLTLSRSAIKAQIKSLIFPNKALDASPAAVYARWREKSYGKNFDDLLAIVTYLQARHIPLLLVRAPQANDWNPANRTARDEFTKFAQTLKVNAWDPYSLYEDEPREISARKYWVEGDPHWNQAGSDRFAREIAGYIVEHWAVPASRQITGERDALR